MCILTETGEKIEGVFGTLTPDLERLRDTLVDHHAGQIAMESTRIYWVPIWRILDTDFDVKLVNSYFIRQLPGRKTDVKDAQWIATVLQKGLIKGSFVPGEGIQQLRLYNRRISYLNRNLQRADQSIDLILQRCNIRLSNYVSDIGGKSMRKVVKALSLGETDPLGYWHLWCMGAPGTSTGPRPYRMLLRAYCPPRTSMFYPWPWRRPSSMKTN